jgi:hypothetical protein
MMLHTLVREFVHSSTSYPFRLNEGEIKKIVKILLRESASDAIKSTTTLADKQSTAVNQEISASTEPADPYAVKMQTIAKAIEDCRFLMSERDHKELADAKLIDQVSYTDEYQIEREASFAWENALYKFLESHEISHMKEEDIREMGHSDPTVRLTSTPDVLILDDLFINNRQVRWIDSKNFLGTSLSFHFLKRLNQQSMKYDEEFKGKGAIIYRLGFTKDLQQKLSSRVLLLDQGPLESTKDASFY